jgi:hypothetical protein
MVATELSQRTTARAVAFANSSNDILARQMTANVPRNGIAVANLPRQHPLPQPAYRLLDSRILNVAAQFLDEDLSVPLLAGLSKYRALVKAAYDSLADPKNAEVMVSLIDPYEITSTHRPYLALVVDSNEIGRVAFEIKLIFGMFETSVIIRRGAIELVECNSCALAITLSLVGWDQPLLHRAMQLPVRLPVRPPVVIPLPGRR